MHAYRLVSVAIGAVLAIGSVALVEAQRGGRGAQATEPPPPSTLPPAPTFRLPGAPSPTIGASVTPALEGWYPNPDGTFTILVGYRNRNQTQQVDVPIGPNNKIEPGGPYDQPTHFDTGRHYGVFSIIVPKDFGTKRLSYTINVNNQPQTIQLGLPGGYQISPFVRSDNGNTPPIVKLDASSVEYVGPPRGTARTLTARVGEPLPLTLYATDTGNTISQQNQAEPATSTTTTPAATAAAAARGARGTRGTRGAANTADAPAAPSADVPAVPGATTATTATTTTAAARAAAARGGVTVRWYKHRGPAGETAKFDPASSPVAADPEVVKMFQKAGTNTGKATTTATFTEPGEYWVRAQVSDGSQLDEQCCWSTVLLKVNVQAATAR